MRKKLDETDEECRARYNSNYKRWLEKPGNKKKKYESDKNTQSTRFRRWQQNHPEKTRAKSALERASRLQRTPLWADLELIELFYKSCPEHYQVDHIIPLNGKIVSGLHVINNLQYLPRLDNLKKGNKFEQ